MWTYNRLDLQTVGSQPVTPKNLPEHCIACRYLTTGSQQAAHESCREAETWNLEITFGAVLRGDFWAWSVRNPDVSKSNWLHVVIFQGLVHSFEVYSIDSSKWMVIDLKSLNFGFWLFLELTLHAYESCVDERTIQIYSYARFTKFLVT